MSLRTRCLRPLLVGAVLVTVSSSASAQPGPDENSAPQGSGPQVNGQSLTQRTTPDSPVDRFGDKGQFAISSDAALTISRTSISDTDATAFKVTLAPALDYFVIRNLSIGGSIFFDYANDGAGHSTRFGVGPRVGYNLPISDLISIWPKAGLSIAHTGVTTETPATATTPKADTSRQNTAIALNLFVPVMFHPAPHFFAGFGPFLDTDLSGDTKATTFGGKLTLGGWL